MLRYAKLTVFLTCFVQVSFNDTSSNNTWSLLKSLSQFSSRDSEGIQVSLDNSAGVVAVGHAFVYIHTYIFLVEYILRKL